MAASALIPSMGSLNQMQMDSSNSSRRKNKKVSWAPEINLCQVRLFLAEDAPVQAGQVEHEELLQAKKPLSLHSLEGGLESDLPPGFEKSIAFPLRKVSITTQTVWKCPPRFVINPRWQVVAGDESEEIKAQSLRELRSLDVVYPRESNIPPCPAEPQDVNKGFENTEAPPIPLIPIDEDDEESPEVEESRIADINQEGAGIQINDVVMNVTDLYHSVNNTNTPIVETTWNMPTSESDTSAKSDIVAAAAATAYEAIKKSSEEGSMIDPDLLIKIFMNPQIMEILNQQIKDKDNNNANNNSLIQADIDILSYNKQNNDIFSVCKPEPEANFPRNYHPQVLQSLSSVLNSSRVSAGGMNSIHSQSSMPSMEINSFTPEIMMQSNDGYEFSNSRTNMLPMSSTFSAQSSHVASRPSVLPVYPVVTQTMKVIPSSIAQIPSLAPTWPGSHNQEYYKNLIQQHGGPHKNDHVNQNRVLPVKHSKDVFQPSGHQTFDRSSHLQSIVSSGVASGILDVNKPKFKKSCMYFNTSKGCKRGASCTFLHDNNTHERPRLEESEFLQPKRPRMEI